jgi:hypothetical protein
MAVEAFTDMQGFTTVPALQHGWTYSDIVYAKADAKDINFRAWGWAFYVIEYIHETDRLHLSFHITPDLSGRSLTARAIYRLPTFLPSSLQ